jgi:hypothetical protein
MFLSYVGQMSWAFASFGEIREKFLSTRIFFIRIVAWTDSKHKWTSIRTCQEGAFDFQEVSIRCYGHQMSSSMVLETWSDVPYSWIFSSTNFGDC